MVVYESVEMTATKEFFPSAWKREYVDFFVRWIRRCVATQHKAVLSGCHLVQGYTMETLQPVELSNVQDYIGLQVPDAELIFQIYQNAVKSAFVAHLSNCDNRKRDHPINAYYDSQMKPHQVVDENGQTRMDPGFPHLHAHRDSDKQTHLNQTSLQDAAKRCVTNWRVSTYRNLWSRTKYWVRLEWKRIAARTPMLAPAAAGHSVRCKVMETWLFGVLLGEQHLQEVAERSREDLGQMLGKHLEKTPSIVRHMAWSGCKSSEYAARYRHIAAPEYSQNSCNSHKLLLLLDAEIFFWSGEQDFFVQ
jgi:hypothetical protein